MGFLQDLQSSGEAAFVLDIEDLPLMAFSFCRSFLCEFIGDCVRFFDHFPLWQQAEDSLAAIEGAHSKHWLYGNIGPALDFLFEQYCEAAHLFWDTYELWPIGMLFLHKNIAPAKSQGDIKNTATDIFLELVPEELIVNFVVELDFLRLNKSSKQARAAIC